MGIDIISLYKRVWQFRVEELQAYVQQSERALAGEIARFEKLATGHQITDDTFVDEHELVHNVVPRYVRYAQLLMIYGVFEYSVLEICQLVERGRSSTLRLQPNLKSMRAYLTSAGMDDSAFGAAWTYLDMVRQMRNCVAHANGVVEEGHPVIVLLSTDHLLGHDMRDYGIVIKAGFAENLIGQVDQAITRIEDAAAPLIRDGASESEASA